MRKNSVRKWLHAILDLLPLFVIPIFAIYTRNENYNSNIEVQQNQNELIDFNQLFNYSNTNTNGMYVEGTKVNLVSNGGGYVNDEGRKLYINHKYLVKSKYVFNYSSPSSSSYTLAVNFDGQVNYILNSIRESRNGQSELIFTMNQTPTQDYLRFSIYVGSNVDLTGSYIYDLQVFDLTQMFGFGNEPTIQEFDNIFVANYYDFTLSHKEYYVVGTTTYNDTDVGSQFVYTLYNATDKYFNCTNLFNLEQVWNWVQLNLFGGNAPLMVYVVWQVIVYEFFMDLIFLLYSVFMFVIDFAENCLERPFDKIRRL